MTDNSIIVGVEWEGKPGNHSLSFEEVRCENVENTGLRGAIGESGNHSGAITTYLDSEGPIHPSNVGVPFLVEGAGIY